MAVRKRTRDDGSDHRIDYPGAVTIALGLIFLTFGFLRIPALGLHNWQVYGSLALGVIILIVFVIIENKRGHPMMPLQLFKNLTFSGANLLTFFLYAGMGAGMLFLSLNMVQVQGYSQLQSGLTFLPFSVSMITFARFAGGLADKHGPRLLLIVGPSVAGAGLLLLSLVKQTHGAPQYWTTFFPGVVVLGLGMSFTVAPLTAAVMGSVSDHFSGTASGVNNAVSRIAGVFTNAIFGTLAVLFFSSALQQNIKPIAINTQQQQVILAQAVDLGNAHVPENVSASDSAAIKTAYHNSFIATYSIIMKIAAALGFAGALMAFIFIRNGAVAGKTIGVKKK